MAPSVIATQDGATHNVFSPPPYYPSWQELYLVKFDSIRAKSKDLSCSIYFLMTVLLVSIIQWPFYPAQGLMINDGEVHTLFALSLKIWFSPRSCKVLLSERPWAKFLERQGLLHSNECGAVRVKLLANVLECIQARTFWILFACEANASQWIMFCPLFGGMDYTNVRICCNHKTWLLKVPWNFVNWELGSLNWFLPFDAESSPTTQV